MEYKIFAVYDSKVSAYSLPYFARSRGEGIRMFTTTVSDPNTSLYKYPEDYSLMEIGVYNDELGAIVGTTGPVNLGLASEYHPRNKVESETLSSCGSERGECSDNKRVKEGV